MKHPRNLTIAALLTLVIIISSCSPKIVYLYTSVPEEGAVSFTQFTDENDKVVYPSIYYDNVIKSLRWYAAPLISISPAGDRLAFIGFNNEFKNLNIKNIEGGKSTVQRTFNRNVLDMSFSRDGKRIIFTDNTNNNSNINLIKTDGGSSIQQVVATSEEEVGPTFDRTDSTVYYSKSDGSRYYIWGINLLSSLQTQYCEGFTPIVGPDNETLYITRNSKDVAKGEIWAVNLNTGIETLILSDPIRGFSSPDISQDGNTIVCVGVTPSSKTKPQNLDIYTIKTDGTQLVQLTFHDGHDVSPRWAPDGNSIFFLSQRGSKKGTFNVWQMNFK